MDPCVRDSFPELESDWENLGFLDAPQPSNLRGKINPVFEKFRGEEKTRAFTGTDEDYERILPAIQLASKYLDSPSSRVFVCSLVYADRKLAPIEDENGVIPFGKFDDAYFRFTEFYKVDPSLCSSDKIDRIWEQLALHTEFGPRELDDIFTRGTTAPKRSEDGEEDGVDLRGSGEICLASKICFNQLFLRDINHLHYCKEEVSNGMLYIQIQLAMTLCHEIAHAIGYATTVKTTDSLGTVISPEPFLEDESIAELGYSFVNEIMGCKFIHYFWAFPQSLPKLTEWPVKLNPKGRLIPRRYIGPTKDSPTEIFVVDMNFVHKVFRQEFWDKLADLPTDEDKSQALKIPKTVGYIPDDRFLEEWKKMSVEEKKKRAPILPKIKFYRDPRPALI